jgi:hypothetical protein
VPGVATRLCAAVVVAAAACAPAHHASGLNYLGQKRVWPGATFQGTVIGGLSAISYDPQHQLYYVISDDRSAKSPARFYTVRLDLSDNGIRDVTFVATHPWLDSTEGPFRPLSIGSRPPVVPPDPEGVAVDGKRQRLYWSSEGERLTDTPGGPVLLDPWVRIAGLDGGYVGAFTMPPGFAMSAANTGPRRNAGIEGLALTPDGRSLFAGMEEPRYDDGEPPNRDRGALTRVTKFDVDTRAPVAQFAYPLEPAGAPAETNGLADLVALSDRSFLTLERAGSPHPVIRIFRSEIESATNVLNVPSLIGVPVTPMTKMLLADLSTTPGLTPLDNVEGISLGPKLPDGHQSVVLVSDDNFNPTQVTQFLAFVM